MDHVMNAIELFLCTFIVCVLAVAMAGWIG